jgi:diacylglycerol diphosphate phosphatase / phosphatidate phosphatase
MENVLLSRLAPVLCLRLFWIRPAVCCITAGKSESPAREKVTDGVEMRFFLDPAQQMFRLDNRSIQYPHNAGERVSSRENTLIAGAGPLAVLIIWAIASRPGVHRVHVAVLGLFFSIYFTTFITDIIKKAVGRPRPDLLSRCQPEPGTPEHVLVTLAVCTQPDLGFLLDGFKSFPSAHSSWAFSGLGYLSFFLAGQMQVLRPPTDLMSILISLAPLVCAATIAMSRVADYRHDIYDVSFGSLLGLTVAYMTYRRDYRPLSHELCDIPYNRRAKRALAWVPEDESEQPLKPDDYEDTELEDAFRVDHGDYSLDDDIELGDYPAQGSKDATLTSKLSSSQPSRKTTSKQPSRGLDPKKQWTQPEHPMVARLRRIVIRDWRGISLPKVILITL